MIRGIDFYNYSFELIRQQENFTTLSGNVENLNSNGPETSIIVNGEKFTAAYIFNSILFEKPILKKNEYYLLQHFKGWVIETELPAFDPAEATLMDFRVDQQQGTTFVYVMPFSETQALIEYTLFSDKLLEPQQYDEGLKKYIHQLLKIDSYKIIEEEFGTIPMTNYQFPVQDGNIINIGTAGGQTKASSGYTFRFIQKHAAALVRQLARTGRPFLRKSRETKRFHFYDSTLLHILHHNKLSGKKIFSDLFRKNKPQQVLRFLDNESSLKDELKIISSLPTFPFLKAALQQL
jgi:lycopene beta-cyclase